MDYKNLFSSESVGIGHPDKICDQISDAILDAYLTHDKNARVACEVFASNRLIVIGGEISSNITIDLKQIAINVLKNINYNANDFNFIINTNIQSPDISQCIIKDNNDIGAGDQGIVFGYATNETKNYMPLAIVIANQILEQITTDIKNKKINFLLYDMKSQVTIDFTHKKPLIHTILVSCQHTYDATDEQINTYISKIMDKVAIEYNLNLDFIKIINPSGKFIIGGPIGDTGLTGRKIIVDTYGGWCRHGGGAFSGKDPTKVDRSGAYFARYIAKNIVAAKIADKCEIQLSFGIGLPYPISIYINTFNTSKYSDEQIIDIIKNCFDLKISSFINHLDLFNTKYINTAVFGHFGKNEFSWEKTDMVDKIQNYIANNFK